MGIENPKPEEFGEQGHEVSQQEALKELQKRSQELEERVTTGDLYESGGEEKIKAMRDIEVMRRLEARLEEYQDKSPAKALEELERLLSVNQRQLDSIREAETTGKQPASNREAVEVQKEQLVEQINLLRDLIGL